MYWLRKLVLYRMDDEDVEKHVDAMTIIHERLSALVTVDNPLTANDIFATALLIAVPATWLHCISHLLNSPQTSSSQIVACLKAEANRRASTSDDILPSVSVSKAGVNDRRNKGSSRDSRPPRHVYNADSFCSFCKINGHDLTNCKTAARVLTDHTRTVGEEFKKTRGGHPSRSSSNTKAAKAQTVTLGYVEGDDNDAPDSEESSDNDEHVTAARAHHHCCQRSHSARTANTTVESKARHTADWTVDSACSRTMTPTAAGVLDLKPDSTPISLADDSTITVSRSGKIALPINRDARISALVVPDLHEPLLSVADVCDKDMVVVFDASGCKVYDSASVNPSSPALGTGY